MIKIIFFKAHINIRKGKQILTYEFNIDVDWRGKEVFQLLNFNQSKKLKT